MEGTRIKLKGYMSLTGFNATKAVLTATKTGLKYDANAPLDVLEFGFAQNGEIEPIPNNGEREVRIAQRPEGTGGFFSAAARVLGLRRVDFDAGAPGTDNPIVIDMVHSGGPVHVLGDVPGRVVEGWIHDVPDSFRLEVVPSRAELSLPRLSADVEDLTFELRQLDEPIVPKTNAKKLRAQIEGIPKGRGSGSVLGARV